MSCLNPTKFRAPCSSATSCWRGSFRCWIIFRVQRRFTLGERLESGLLTVLEALVEAAYTRQKQAALKRANRRLAVNRHLWRLAVELRVINLKRYEHGIRLMDDLGFRLASPPADPESRCLRMPRARWRVIMRPLPGFARTGTPNSFALDGEAGD